MSRFTTLKTSCAALAAVLILSSYGCTTLDPYTREEKVSNATKGAAIGTVAGAAVGYLTAHDKSRQDKLKHTLIGAGVGALGGTAVGHYMDRQEMELRQRLEGSGVSVSRAGDNLILNMPGHVTFSVNRTDLNPQFFEVLNSVALVLKEYEKTAIEIAGHTDSSGSDIYNLRLSERRADSVAAYLAGQEIPRLRMQTIGFGEARPVASNQSQDGKQLNRRVELTLMPLTQG
jgi:outer membrane protein OmpA-like peptidoglycan-associated protein